MLLGQTPLSGTACKASDKSHMEIPCFLVFASVCPKHNEQLTIIQAIEVVHVLRIWLLFRLSLLSIPIFRFSRLALGCLVAVTDTELGITA
jgi:hypothetical protein